MKKSSITVKREHRLLQMQQLIAAGLKSSEIMQRLKINERTYYKDVSILKQRLQSSDALNEMAVRMLALRHDNLVRSRELLDEAVDVREHAEVLRVVNQSTDGFEKTAARLGLIPKEEEGLPLSGTLRVVWGGDSGSEET